MTQGLTNGNFANDPNLYGFKDPKITIGGVSFISQNFNWGLIPGAKPYITNIMIPRGGLSDRLRRVKNPTNIKIEVYGGLRGKADKETIEIDDVFLIQPKAINAINDYWQIADKRFAWRGEKLFFSYNMTRQKNDFIRTVSTKNVKNDPGEIRKTIDRYSSGRYIPWTVKEDGTPYSMLEIIYTEIVQRFQIPINKQSFLSENISYTVENVEYQGVDVYEGINSLLSRSRLSLGLNLKGEFEVYSVDFFDNSSQSVKRYLSGLKRVTPSELYDQELKRIRPRYINIHFEKKVETKLVASTSEDQPAKTQGGNIDGTIEPLPLEANPPSYTQKNIEDRQVIGCENVIPVPYPRALDGGKKLYNIGEYVPMWKYLKSLGLTDQDVRTYFFSDQLAYIIALKNKTAAEIDLNRLSLSFHIASTIKKHYRQTYQIDPYYMDRIKKWETKRTGIVDNYSRFSSPSPVWSDYAYLPNTRVPMLAKKYITSSAGQYQNIYVDQFDPDRENVTPASLQMVNQPLGIFRIAFPGDIHKNIQQFVPSAIVPATNPYVSISSVTAINTNIVLSPFHTMESLISVVWNVDRFDKYGSRNEIYNNLLSLHQKGVEVDAELLNQGSLNILDSKYKSITLDYSTKGGEGPTIEYLSKLDYARYKFPEIAEGGQLKQSEPQNIGNLEAIAQAEGGKLINQYIDRVSGHTEYAGAITGPLKLVGNITSIVYSFSNEKGLTTKISFAEHTPTPTMQQQLPQSVLNYLERQVTRAEDQNTIA